jgi:hypothetical protein
MTRLDWIAAAIGSGVVLALLLLLGVLFTPHGVQ